MLDLHFLLPARNSPGSTFCNVNKLNSDDNATIDGGVGQYDPSEDPVRARASAIVKAQCSRSMVNVSQTKIESTDNDKLSTPYIFTLLLLFTYTPKLLSYAKT